MTFDPRSAPRLARRDVLRAALLALAVPSAISARGEIALSTAINRSGMLLTLSQRCAKAYAQEFLGVLPEHAREIGITARRLIGANLDELTRGHPPSEIAQVLHKTSEASKTLHDLMERERTKDGVQAVAREADVLLDEADQLRHAYETAARHESARLITLAGRQRMLSQRVTKNYFLEAAGFRTKAYKDLVEADRGAFGQALTQLENASLSTPAIRNELALARGQWGFFSAAIEKPSDPESMRTVATTSERLLETMDNLTELYDAALKDLLGKG
jgi:hypothetical protein